MTIPAHRQMIHLMLGSAALLAGACAHPDERADMGPIERADGIVLEQWESALGLPCRRIRRDVHYVGPLTVLECLDKDGWRRIRDLAAYDGVPPVPQPDPAALPAQKERR